MDTLKTIAKHVGKKLMYLIPVLIVVLFINYYLLRQLPGDPVKLYVGADRYALMTAEEIAHVTARLGVDKSIVEQYFLWLGRLLRGDTGMSLTHKINSVAYIKEPLKNTLILNSIAFLISFPLAIWIGVKQAVKRGSRFDNGAKVFTLLGLSLPSFIIALMSILVFSVILKWTPISGMFDPAGDGSSLIERLHYMALPLFVITFGSLASISRYVRTATTNSLGQDFIRTARAKGLSERRVIWQHGFRNSLIPVVTLLGLWLPGLFAGSIIIESIFNWYGLGNTLLKSIYENDINVTMTITTMFVIITLASYILVDIGYTIVDPRTRK